jgi:hypothetical protein
VPECDRRTTIGKAQYAAFLDASKDADVIVSQSQWEASQAMREAVMGHPYARALLEDGRPEVSALWDQFGTECKARFDWLPEGYEVIVDLKTCQDASPAGFAKACGNWSYHIQAALYSMAAEACGLGSRQMVFIAVESEAPHLVAMYVIDEQSLIHAANKIGGLIAQYQECRATDTYPGYSKEIETVTIPPWSL